jgi:hypothetical protein
MEKFTKHFIVVICATSILFSSFLVEAYCVDRKTVDRPNTGYCTIENNVYMCLPGGVTCDGDGNGGSGGGGSEISSN